MALAPVQHRARVREHPGLLSLELPADEPQVLELDVGIRERREHGLDLGDFGGEVRLGLEPAEQDQFARKRCGPEAGRGQEGGREPL